LQTSEVLATLALLYVNAMICDDSAWKITQHAAVLAFSFVSDLDNPYEKFFMCQKLRK